MSKRMLLIGEPMGLFIADSFGRLEYIDKFSLSTCGAELNVAIGLRRLGHNVTYFTKLGHDLLATRILHTLTCNGISTDSIIYSDTASTGFMFKSRVADGDPDIYYCRKGSAASTLSPQDIMSLDYTEFDGIHFTGITPALSASTRDASKALIRLAKQHNCMFSFDPNLRFQLWSSKQDMISCINQMAFQADLFFPGIGEAEQLTGKSSPEAVAEFYLLHGTKAIVVKLGERGAYYSSYDGQHGFVHGFPAHPIVDTVGAGDGFAAGVLSALREGLSLEQAVLRGCAVGAIQVMSRGDNDGLPTRQELKDFMDGKLDWRAHQL